MKKGDKEMKVWGLVLILVIIGLVFGGLIATASATDYNNIAIESCTVFKCQNCESYKVVTDPWNYPDTTALCYVHKGQYYAWTGETYGGWRKIWVAPYSNDYKGTTGWIYEGTYWARETKTVLRAKTTLAVYKSPGSGLYGYIYSGQKFYYLGSSGEWFKIQMCGDTAGGGAMQGWVHGLSTREITVTSPNGGENWQRGTVHTITWTSSNAGSYVKIDLYKGGSYDRTITSSTSNDGSYSWNIPSTLATGTNYKIKITSTSYTDVSDMSNSYFTISKREITVTSPNGGENWQRGTVHTIAWTSSNAGSYVKIDLYKGGSYDRTITSSTSNDGSYSWNIPSTLATGTNYKIKITSTSYTDVSDMSSSYFTISKVQTQVKGIDVSHWQGDIDWSQVYNAGYRFAFAKATGGDASPPQIIDDHFETNMDEGHNAGMLMGSYHFAYPQYNDAVDEAHFFVSVAGEYFKEGYLRPALDVEEGGGYLTNEELSNWIHEWMNTVKNETGIEPILYVNSNYAKNYLDSSVAKYDLWIAHWTYDPNIPPNTGIWDDWDFWQYSDEGSVPGISGNVDLDLFNGDMSRLYTFTIIGEHIPPTVDAFSVNPLSVTIGDAFNISYTVSDKGGSGLNRVELWRKSETVDWKEIKRTSLAGVGDGPYSGSFSDSPSSVGTYWYGVHAVDDAGNWAPEDSSIEVEVTQPDVTPPPPPIISSSTHPNENNWYNNNDPSFTWTAPSDASGIAGYSYTLDHSSSTTPNTYVDTTGNFASYSNKADGTWYFHVRAKDNAENWGSADHYRVKIDTANPPAPSPDDGVSGWSTDYTPTFSWSAPSDTSGIAGYYWKVGSGSETWTTSTSVTLPAQSDGIRTFYVRAKDNAGNIGNYGSHEFKIDTANPPAPSPDDGVFGWSNDNTPTFSWSAPSDTSGIAGYYWKVGSGSETWTTSTSITLPAQSDGIRTFYVRAKDNAGNIGNYGSHEFKIDTANPSAPSPDDGVSGWSNGNTPTFSWSTPSDTSGIAGYYWKVGSGSETWITSTSVTLPAQSDGIRTFYVRAKDNAGNIGNYGSHEFKIDTAKPPAPSPDDGITGWSTDNTPTFSWSAPSDTSGIAGYYYKADSGSEKWTTSTYVTLPAQSDGIRTFYVKAKDNAGNIGNYGSHQFKIDTAKPPAPSPDDGVSGWGTDNTPTFSWSTPSDTSGIAGYYWKVGSGSEKWTTSTSVTLPSQSDGTHTFYVKAKDNAGNIGSYGSHEFKIDTTQPSASISINNGAEYTDSRSVTLYLFYSDTTSGVDKCRYKNEGESWTGWESCSSTKSWMLTEGDGAKTVYYQVKDNSGNIREVFDMIILQQPDTTPPTWDTTVGIQSATDTGKGGEVTVTYGTATDADSPPVKYNVYYSTSSPATGGAKLSNVGSSPYTVTGLANGQLYYFSVRVEDSATPPNEDTNTIELTVITTLTDSTPPVISSVGSPSITKSSATVTWSTDEISDSLVKYGTASGIYPYTKYDATDVTSHSIDLTGLSASTTYYYIVNSTDPSGNSAESAEYNFTTLAEITPPTITSVSPADGATGVPVTTTISAIFSEAMNTASAETAFSITPSVAGTFSWAGNTMTFTPTANLAYSTTYTVTISTVAEDLVGNNLEEDYTWSFTTAAAPPVLTSITVSPSTATLYVDNTQQFIATAYDQYGNPMAGIVFTWTSSNLTVGTINANGLFTVKAAGKTTVRAANGTVCGTAEVIVTTTCIPPNVSWNMTISATNQLEPVVVGKHPNASDSYDPDYDVFAQTPVQGKVILILDDVYSTSIKKTRCYNEPASWNLSVGVPTGQTTTLSWNVPSNVNLTIREGNSILYSGVELSEGSHELLVTAKLNESITFSLKLKPGWNMVSLPIIPDNSSVDAIFGGIPILDTMPVVTWESPSFVPVTCIEPKIGYWVFTPADTTITVTGKPITNTTLILEAGWNMVGTVDMESLTISNIPNQVPERPAVTWIAPSFVETDIIEAGKSAWVFVTTDILVMVGETVSTEVKEKVVPTITKIKSAITPVAITNEWNLTISATNQLEPVTFGIHPDATNGYDEYDEFVQIPIQGKVIMILDDIYATEINRDKLTWNLSVGVPVGETTTLTWDSSKIPADVTLTLNGIDMKSQNSMEFGEGSHLFVISGTTGEPTGGFDTGLGTYPSISGTHIGTITPNQTITVSKLYTYPCAGTGGHSEHVRIWNDTWAGKEAYWKGYQNDWHNITFDEPFTLFAEKTYNYEIRTGSYPQIIHKPEHTTLDGSFINCTSFVDANGKEYTDWIPAIRLFL